MLVNTLYGNFNTYTVSLKVISAVLVEIRIFISEACFFFKDLPNAYGWLRVNSETH